MHLFKKLVLIALAVSCAGCSAFWPTVVRTSPREPLFHSGFPLVGGARTDAALCSLATVGPEATLLVSPPEKTDGAVPLSEVCGKTSADAGRVQHAPLVEIETAHGTVYGFLFARETYVKGVLVAFSGLGMPPAGWINQRFAAVSASHGYAVFAPVRDERARPIYFDPVREARRAIDAASRIRESCRFGPALGFLGISLGGLEALVANREASRRGMVTRAAVLDPVLDVQLVTDNLDSFWHGLAVDSMQAYFRRILAGRYQEWPPPSFRDVMDRTRTHADALTDLLRDQPSAWLCSADREVFAIFLSDTDPVLGHRQREFARACRFPLRAARAPGHTPLACRLELFEEMVAAAVAVQPPWTTLSAR